MNATTRHLLSILAFSLQPIALWSASSPEQSLADWGPGANLSQVQTTDARVSQAAGAGIRVDTRTKGAYPGILLKAPGGRWNLETFQHVAVEVKNVGTEKITVSCRVDNPGADGNKNCVTSSLNLEPGAANTLYVNLNTTPWRLSRKLDLIGMRGAPDRNEKIDPTLVNQILIFVGKPKTPHAFELSSLRAAGPVALLDANRFLPFIDEYGQFIHSDWPGKIHNAQEFNLRIQSEKQDMAANPGPAARNKFGGWTGGPQLKATGFFRAEKYEGKWWLVDPDGRLFWSHGTDCVRMENDTPITDRENYFRQLPQPGTPFAEFYGSGNWAPHGYYQGKSRYRTYDFSRANLLRKYGKSYEQAFADLTHLRLRSWGMNTIANWSASRIYGLRRTPYTANISFSSKVIEGSKGYWGKFFDVFDPSFRENLRLAIGKEKGQSLGDPWCLGFFVHNEIGWGDDTSLAVAALSSPPDQPAKLAFLEDLKAKYKSIGELNKAWGTKHESWQSLLRATNAPASQGGAGADLRAFYTKIAETYFRIIREELKAAAPNQLYLGCRFAWVNDLAAKAATKYCDVISYNRYDYSVETQKLPDNMDLPIIIGEFHFGALDRGMFHTGLRKAANQQDRGLKYKSYVQGALRNPLIVGTHWFQFKDQATTGRGDGENYQIGLVDICDTPYPETIQACREVGYGLYEYRLRGGP